MSDINSDYYSDSSESDNSQSETFLAKKKQSPILNVAKQFGNYIDDESEPEIDDSEPDDTLEEQNGGYDETELDEIKKEGSEISDDENNNVINDDDDDADNEDEDEDDEEDDDDIEIDEEGEPLKKNEKQAKASKPKKTTQLIIDDEDDDDEYEENYLQKFENNINKNYITDFHPECLNHNSDEVSKLSTIIRDDNNIIIDPFHRTLPYLTKYEKARILGQRAKQIENGAKPFIKVPENIIDSYVIAELELREKKIPFIIKRPLPNGAFEYWNIKDLEIINF